MSDLNNNYPPPGLDYYSFLTKTTIEINTPHHPDPTHPSITAKLVTVDAKGWENTPQPGKVTKVEYTLNTPDITDIAPLTNTLDPHVLKTNPLRLKVPLTLLHTAIQFLSAALTAILLPKMPQPHQFEYSGALLTQADNLQISMVDVNPETCPIIAWYPITKKIKVQTFSGQITTATYSGKQTIESIAKHISHAVILHHKIISL